MKKNVLNFKDLASKLEVKERDVRKLLQTKVTKEEILQLNSLENAFELYCSEGFTRKTRKLFKKKCEKLFLEEYPLADTVEKLADITYKNLLSSKLCSRVKKQMELLLLKKFKLAGNNIESLKKVYEVATRPTIAKEFKYIAKMVLKKVVEIS